MLVRCLFHKISTLNFEQHGVYNSKKKLTAKNVYMYFSTTRFATRAHLDLLSLDVLTLDALSLTNCRVHAQQLSSDYYILVDSATQHERF